MSKWARTALSLRVLQHPENPVEEEEDEESQQEIVGLGDGAEEEQEQSVQFEEEVVGSGRLNVREVVGEEKRVTRLVPVTASGCSVEEVFDRMKDIPSLKTSG